MPLLADAECRCDWPVLWEVGSPTFLGRLVTIRLCCLMTYIEGRFEIDFHETKDTEPAYAWNEGATGRPIPEYIAQRIEAKKAAGFSMDAPLEPSLMTRLSFRMQDPTALDAQSLDNRRKIIDIMARAKNSLLDISRALTNDEEALIRQVLSFASDADGNVDRAVNLEDNIRSSAPVATGNRAGWDIDS